MKYQISELIDLPALQALMDSLHRATGINHALIDNDSRVLTASGWEPVCTGFHRMNPRTCERCEASDRHILAHLHDGPYVGYECPNGLMDYATPVIIDGEHLANVFTGQMFHSPPDLEYFRRQAAEFGFDEAAYLEQVQQVRIVPRDRMPEVMAFLVGLAETLGRQGLTRMRQLEAESELRQLNVDLSQRVREATRELLKKNHLLSLEVVQHEQAEAALRQEKQFSDDIINSLPGIFYMLDQDGRFVRWNRQLLEVTGYGPDELVGMAALELFDRDTAPLIRDRIRQVFQRGDATVEAPLKAKDGRLVPYYFTGHRTPIGRQPYLVGVGMDITARKALEAELEKQAHEDSLTGMATRRHFFELAEREMARSRRYGCSLSFAMLDIDQFKELNDRHGHGAGDRVLREFARICRASLRAVDVVGRMGGDEFAILLPRTDARRALLAAERLRRAVAALRVEQAGAEPLGCTISIGVTTLADRQGSIDILFSQADEALYRAKRDGRDRVVAFPPAA